MKILFVCKHNRFRSKVGEAFFNKLNTNKNIITQSAGIFQGYPIADTVKAIAKEFNLTLTMPRKTISEDLLKWSDHIIITAKDVPLSLFDHDFCKKVIKWNIPDTKDNNKEEIKRIFSIIEKLKENGVEWKKLSKEKKFINSLISLPKTSLSPNFSLKRSLLGLGILGISEIIFSGGSSATHLAFCVFSSSK